MTRGDILEAVAGGDENQVRTLFTEMAWSRARAALGIGFDERPFSPYEADRAQRQVLLAEIRALGKLMRAETAHWQTMIKAMT